MANIETLTKELNAHLIAYHAEKNEIRNKVNEIRVEQNRLNLLMGQFADLNTKLDKQSRAVFELNGRIEKFEESLISLLPITKPKSFLDKLFRR